MLSDREQAAGGIGEETAFAFTQADIPAIAFADLDEQKAGKVAETSKSLATNSDYCTFVIAVDVTDPPSVQRMVDETVRKFGRIDYNVNSAGLFGPLLPIFAEFRTNSCSGRQRFLRTDIRQRN